MRLSIKKATADSVSRWLQKYLDTTNILQYPEEEFAIFDFLVCRPYHRYTNYVHGIGNGNSRRDIPCPVTVGSYLLTINAVLLISTLSFKYLFLRCADSLNFHLYITIVQ